LRLVVFTHWQGDGETGLALKFRRLGFLAIYQRRALVRHRIPTSRLSVEYFERRGYSNSSTHHPAKVGNFASPKLVARFNQFERI
jgi:hypothetical protein